MYEKQWWKNYEINSMYKFDIGERKGFINEEELLKITIAFIAASNSFISCINDAVKRDDETEKLKQYFIILIRIIILSFSLNYKWPLVMCATISVIISILTKIEDILKIKIKYIEEESKN